MTHCSLSFAFYFICIYIYIYNLYIYIFHFMSKQTDELVLFKGLCNILIYCGNLLYWQIS